MSVLFQTFWGGAALPHCQQIEADLCFSGKMQEIRENCEIGIKVCHFCTFVLLAERFMTALEIKRNSDDFWKYFCPLKTNFWSIERADVFMIQFIAKIFSFFLGMFSKWKASVWTVWSAIQNTDENVSFLRKNSGYFVCKMMHQIVPSWLQNGPR